MGELHVDASVRIARSVEEVLAVLQDISTQHEWWPGQFRSEPLETDEDGQVARALIGNDVKVAKDEFEVVYAWRPDGYSWDLAAPSNLQRAQAGSWELRPDGDGATEATLRLMVDSTLPLPGFLLRKALQDTVNGATKSLRQRCES